MKSNFPVLEEITHEGVLLSIIIRADYSANGLRFFTPHEFSQQVAYMHHPAGKVIDAHVHVPVARDVSFTQEVLLIKNGKLRVDFYDLGRNYIKSRVLCAGDVILLAAAGHGFEVLDDLEMIEVKQGPYAGDADKIRFSTVKSEDINFDP